MRFFAGIGGLLCGMIACASARETEACLFAETPIATRTFADCKLDPLGLAKLEPISVAISALRLQIRDIEFVGCPKALFATGHPSKYRIFYPSTAPKSLEEYVPPLIHELGHVYQLSHFGSTRAALTERYKLIQIELGADYLAGFIAGRYLDNSEMGEFAASLRISGLYRESSSEAHGTPTQRTAAFRFGYFASAGHNSGSIDAAYMDFDDDHIRFLIAHP